MEIVFGLLILFLILAIPKLLQSKNNERTQIRVKQIMSPITPIFNLISSMQIECSLPNQYRIFESDRSEVEKIFEKFQDDVRREYANGQTPDCLTVLSTEDIYFLPEAFYNYLYKVNLDGYCNGHKLTYIPDGLDSSDYYSLHLTEYGIFTTKLEVIISSYLCKKGVFGNRSYVLNALKKRIDTGVARP